MIMAQESGRPAGYPWISPYLTVKDAGAALEFYQRAFGFTVRSTHKGPDGSIWHAEMTWHDAVVMFSPEGAYGGPCKAPATLGTQSPVALMVYCDDVDALFARATAAGAQAMFPPMDMFWGDRMCKLTDPDGHLWSFATHTGVFSAPPTGDEPACVVSEASVS
jgi:uncharacterized glyoxalase superfamily protein PhnB